ncbi:MAG: hypothetical protein ACE14P_09245 [Methanotrichaceae archaeon]
MSRKSIFNTRALVLYLLIGITCGQDWLGGGYVGSSGTIYDPGLAGMMQWLDTPIYYYYYPSYPAGGALYPGLYGAYPFSPLPYYSDFRQNSLSGMDWEPFQKNWSETMDYAQTKSSFRIYPRPANAYPAVQFPAPINTAAQVPATTTGDSIATIVSQGMRGYQVFLDGTYIGTEGTGGDPLDGTFTFRVVGNQYHDIRVYDGQFNYPKTIFFERGGTKIIHVEPGMAIYV